MILWVFFGIEEAGKGEAIRKCDFWRCIELFKGILYSEAIFEALEGRTGVIFVARESWTGRLDT